MLQPTSIHTAPEAAASSNTSAYPAEWSCSDIAAHAVSALLDEVYLPGKPGLIGPDGSRGHEDMDIDTMVRSALCLEETFKELAQAGSEVPPGQELRDLLGTIGRAGETKMMEVTGGVNTHRGAIWNLGLMAAATGALTNFAPAVRTASAVTALAGALASISDSAADSGLRPGAAVRKRYGIGGAVSEAATGFPHVHAALAQLHDRSAHTAPMKDESAIDEDTKLLMLLRIMGTLEDTCILHRGGPAGLQFTTAGAHGIISAHETTGKLDRALLVSFDREMTNRNLSPGGSADLLACALFLTSTKVH